MGKARGAGAGAKQGPAGFGAPQAHLQGKGGSQAGGECEGQTEQERSRGLPALEPPRHTCRGGQGRDGGMGRIYNYTVTARRGWKEGGQEKPTGATQPEGQDRVLGSDDPEALSL